MNTKTDRETALDLLSRYVTDESLLRHALTVEAVMRYQAKQTGEDEEKWGIIGLLHDLDYEKYPDQHCAKTAEIMKSEGWPDDYIHAVVSHGYGIVNDTAPVHPMEKFLYASDELTGLITATVLVRPSKSVLDMEVKSVKKKWKDKSFAAGVNREVISRGSEMLGMEINDLISTAIMGMRAAAGAIGLDGSQK